MEYILMVIATVMIAFWVIVSLSVGKAQIANSVKAQMNIKQRKIAEEKAKLEIKLEELAEIGQANGKRAENAKKSSAKKTAEIQKELDKLKKGKAGLLNIIPSVGYILFSMNIVTADSKLFQDLKNRSEILYGKPGAAGNAAYMLAFTASYVYLSAALALMIMSIMSITGRGSDGIVLSLALLLAAVVLCYLPFDELREKTEKRQAEITAQFPNVISKMALLVTSGMEVARAWELVSEKGRGALYDEMRKATDELNNNISPAVAYTNFMNNCSNKYTTKLATSILQNISKGNSEIGAVFNQLADESWAERKHNAKRLGELAQGKLMVPTLLMFAGIMALVMVPIAMNMGSMG
ncbi:MAG: type II secretion system F family protein [Huintestinicola sp.]|uniref:type II secretion system F family protein n=1 Tax=Huintestinicola sp. TaxID=2981661 RepID=UPI003F01A9A8